MKNKEFWKNVATSIFCASIAFIGGYNAGQIDVSAPTEPESNVWTTKTTNPADAVVEKVEKKGTTFSFEEKDSIVTTEVTPVGVKREDGLLVPTHLVVKTTYTGGSTKVDSVRVNLSDEQILLFNGVYRSKVAANWERK